MGYVLSFITSLSSTDLKEITLKARGNAITTAIDEGRDCKKPFR